MRYQVEAKGEYTYLLGEFATGETVTIVVYNILTGVVVPLDSSSCAEIATSGWFRWNTQNITTPVTLKTDYLYIMTDSNGLTYSGKFIVGGYVDLIDVALSNMEGSLNVIIDNTDDIIDNTDDIIDNTDDIVADTNELQTNQGNWLTATGFAPSNEYDARMAAIQADLDNPDQYKATGFAVANEYDLPLSLIQADVVGLNGDAMRGTDGSNTVEPDNTGISDSNDKLDESSEKLNTISSNTSKTTTQNITPQVNALIASLAQLKTLIKLTRK